MTKERPRRDKRSSALVDQISSRDGLRLQAVRSLSSSRSGLEARAQRLSAGQRNREEEDEMSVVFS